MIVVTGAGGFIGSHLVEALLTRGRKVLALDLGEEVPASLAGNSLNERFQYASCDLRRPESLFTVIPRDVDVIYHLAATVGVDSYIRDPLGTIDNNVLGTRNVLEACVKRNIGVVYVSSSEVYGKNPDVPWNETADRVLGNPSIDRWSYATSKGLCEHMVNAVHKRFGVTTTVVRPFNVYGPRQRPSFIIPAAVHSVLNGRRPVVYDDGTQTRCFTYIDDLVNGLLVCVESKAAAGETFNLGSSNETTINDAIQTVLKVCGSSLQPIRFDTKKQFGDTYEDIERRVPDVSKAHRVLGWRANTSLVEGVTKTVAWAKSHPEWLSS
jgi:nucleoside-diphosphate-sugar epimerase